MNLKFFILGLCVLVTIAQVKAESKAKRQTPYGYVAPQPPPQASGRRFNPMDALGKLAKKPMDMAFDEAINKLFASYNDPTKPFGPTYDTTYGSPPPSTGRRMDNSETPSISTIDPVYYGYPAPRSFGHSLEPTLPYQNHYDSNVNGRQTVFTSPNPGYFPHARRDDHYISAKIQKIAKETPEEIEKLLAELKFSNKGVDEVSMRHGFLGDVYDSEENGSRRSGSHDIIGKMEKLLAASVKSTAVLFVYLRVAIEELDKDQIYDMVIRLLGAFNAAVNHLQS